MTDSYREKNVITASHQAPLWNSPCKNTGVSCHSLAPGDLPDPKIKPESPASQADSLLSEPSRKPNIGTKSYANWIILPAKHYIRL